MEVKVVSEKNGQGKIWIDGKELKGVRKVNVSLEARESNLVTVEFYADKLEVELKESDIKMEEVSHEQK